MAYIGVGSAFILTSVAGISFEVSLGFAALLCP